MKKQRDVKFIVTLIAIWGLTAIICASIMIYTNNVLKKNDSTYIKGNSSAADFVDKNLTTVDFTIPKELFMGQTPTTTLTEEDKANGYIAAKLNDDGSVTYTIKKENYKRLVEEYKADTIKSINDTISSGDYPSIKKASYSNDLSKITLYVDKAAYQSSYDSAACLAIELSAGFYNIVADTNKDCVISLVDIATNEAFDTYPNN